MTGRFSQVYVSGLNEVDRVMILDGNEYVHSIYIKLLYIIIYNNSIIQVLNNQNLELCSRFSSPWHSSSSTWLCSWLTENLPVVFE